MIVMTPSSRRVRSRKRKRDIEEKFFGRCGFGEEIKGDGYHGSSEIEDSGLQEQLSNQEVGRGAGRDGSLDDSRDGGGI